MYRKCVFTLMTVLLIVGGTGCFSFGQFALDRLRIGANPDELYPGWAETDRCTKCHMAWTWEYGYYRGWDRHGLISDYSKVSPAGYKDPYGLDVPVNTFKEYYYTPWWEEEWTSPDLDNDPPMQFGGYDRVNDGTVTPDAFDGIVIVVDQSGRGDVKTIRDGIARADSGATVFVRPGTYLESIVLKPGIRLWGEDAYTTIIDSENKASAIVAANHCDISGFTLTGTGFDYSEDRFRAAVHAIDCDSTLVIRGNLFFSNSVFGVLVESSRSDGYVTNSEQRYIEPENALEQLAYTGTPNPRIIGNTFYNIGERAIYCIHAAPEIANNIFMGNLKTLGMTQQSTPFIHHNVFYRNTVSININRSKPVVTNNIMYNNYWGQRIMEGSFPVVHDNVTWESPYYSEFAEDGRHQPFDIQPGIGERSVDPRFVDADGGDFNLAEDSPLQGGRRAESCYGIYTAPGIQTPPTIACSYSWADEFLNRTDETNAIIDAVDRQNDHISSIDAAYTVTYRSFMAAEYDSSGNQLSVELLPEPVSGTDYMVQSFVSDGVNREKTYTSNLFAGMETLADSGTVRYDGTLVNALSGRFKTDYAEHEHAHMIGELPSRENIGGLYFDYDQYLHGAIGPGGTFYYGYLRILGGEVLEETEFVDGHECVVARYPHLGSDQVYKFYLDPSIGYRPRRLEQYFERQLYRRIDSYVYTEVDGAYLPVSTLITDYAVKEPYLGRVIGITSMQVDPNHFIVNGTPQRIGSLLPGQPDMKELARIGTWTPPPKESHSSDDDED